MIDRKIRNTFVIILLAGVLCVWSRGLEASPKGALNIVDATAEPGSLDPHLHYSTQLSSILRQIYDNLFERDPSGKLVSALIESWENIDRTTWQFKVRKGVRFHNGDEFTAQDVKFSLERILDPETKSPQARDCRTVNRIEVMDKYAVNIITSGPDPILPERFVVIGNVLPEKAFKNQGEIEFFKHPIGAGPFKFARWDKGKEMVLEANEEYYRGSPRIQKVVFKFVSGEKERVEMLLNGACHIVTNVMPQYSLTLKQNRNIRLLKKPNVQCFVAKIDALIAGPLSDKRIRKALNYLTDVDLLIKYIQKGNGRLLATFTMPEEFGYNPELKPYPFDLEKARDLLRTAGYPNGFKIKMLTMEHLSALGTALKKQWQKAGVIAELILLPREEVISRGLIKKEISWDVVISDPTDPLFDSSYQMIIQLDPKHPLCRFHNEKIIELLSESNTTLDKEKRSSILKNIQEIVYEEAPMVFLYQNVGLYGVRVDVVDFVPYADTMLRLHNVSLGGNKIAGQ
jgi:peptide/nickel transport system substrate-binding protein